MAFRFRHRSARLVAGTLARGLRLGGRPFYRFIVDSLWERQPWFDPAEEIESVELYYPGYVDPDAADRPLVERIFAAYRLAKDAQTGADPVFLPSRNWRAMIAGSYSELVEAGASGDLDRFHFFLANFRAWRQTIGIEASQLIAEAAGDPAKRKHVEERMIAPSIRWWLRCESGGRGLPALEAPRHGNQVGVLVDGHLVSPGSVFSEIYGRMLAGFVSGERPVIAELGAGFGRLLYFISRQLASVCFVDFDLPETLACASYFLLKTFPDRRALLFGEGRLTPAALEAYDLVLLPSFAIADMPDRAADLFINENSLGEMDPAACRLFVAEICRSSRAFFHRNAESSRVPLDDGETSLVNSEYPIPEDEFELVVRYCDVGRLMAAGRLNFDRDMYWYLYRRRGDQASTAGWTSRP